MCFPCTLYHGILSINNHINPKNVGNAQLSENYTSPMYDTGQKLKMDY